MIVVSEGSFAMAFSGAVKLADVSDYIAPSQSCVVALNGNKVDTDVSDLGQVSLQRRTTTTKDGGSGLASVFLKLKVRKTGKRRPR